MIVCRVLAACAVSAALIATPTVADAFGTDLGNSYEVQSGDSLYRIAARYDISVASLLRINDLTITSLILPGQHLRLPADATTPTPATTPSTSSTATSGDTHTVAWGDSLYRIANRYDISVASLLRINDLTITSLILPGQHLRLPADATAPAALAAGAEPPVPAPAPASSSNVGAAMLCPVAGPRSFADTWAAPRSGGRRHEGVDMFAPTGTPVVAVESGSATFKRNKLGGNTVWVNGTSGTSYYYAHLNAWAGSSRSVSQGEVIGYVGATGNTIVDHLHFEVHPGGGVAVNPGPYVRAAC